jgi:dihydroorotate dehydrogenase electron transfer subunit
MSDGGRAAGPAADPGFSVAEDSRDLALRFGLPPEPVWLGLAQLLAREEWWPGSWWLRLHAPAVAAAIQPGQFIHVRPPGEDLLLRRPLSLYDADPAAGTIEVLFKSVGAGTARLATLHPGAPVDVLGPAGRGFRVAAEAGRALIVSGGLGVAPFVALSRLLLERHWQVRWLHGALGSRHLFPRARVPEGVDYREATDDGSAGFHGRVGAMLEARSWDGWRPDVLYTCGPEPMMDALAERLARDPAWRGVPMQASLEAHMGCGLGVCLGCVVPTASGYERVCTEGPVFDATHAWPALFSAA